MEVGDEHVVEGGEMKRSEAKVLSERSVDERDIYVAIEALTRRLMTSMLWRAMR